MGHTLVCIQIGFQFFPILLERMNLEPYGIHLTLRKGIALKDLTTSILHKGSFSRSQGRFELSSGIYSLGDELGCGSYGKIYQAIHVLTNQVFAIKVINVHKQSHVANTLKESIMNILLEKESETQPDGPYVPRFYELAYDPDRNLILMRIERLHGTLNSIYQAASPQQNDQLVPETLADVAHILNFFYNKLQFNHRDLKSDNIGFFLKDEKHKIRLFDFGFACLTWKGIHIAGCSYFNINDACYIPSRDLSQLLYELVVFDTRILSPRLRYFLQTLLTFPMDHRICRLFEGCRYKGHNLLKQDWDNIYSFLNLGMENPNTMPKELYRRMLGFLGQDAPAETSPVTPVASLDLKYCLPEQIFNPRTRRCVRRSSKTGKRILRRTEKRTPTRPAKTRKRGKTV